MFKKENIFTEKLNDCSEKLDTLTKMKNAKQIDEANENDVNIIMLEVLLYHVIIDEKQSDKTNRNHIRRFNQPNYKSSKNNNEFEIN